MRNVPLSQEQQDKIWNYFQSSDLDFNAFDSETRYKFIARQLTRCQRVLNIGVGRGGLERILLTRGIEAYSLDPSDASIANLRKTPSMEERAKVGYSQKIPFPDNFFDAVIMTEVLEHLPDEVLTATMPEIRRVLKPGGRFIGTVPADERLSINAVMCPHCGKGFHRWGHQQSFDTVRLSGLIGTTLSSVRVTRHCFGDYQALNWKGKAALILKRIKIRLGGKGSGENFFFQGIKRAGV